MRYDSRGRELPDDTPIEVPIGFRRPPTLQEEIRRLIRTEMSQSAVRAGMESFQEADDFDVGDEELPFSPHELTELQEEAPIVKEKRDDAGPGRSGVDAVDAVHTDRRGSGRSADQDRRGSGGRENSGASADQSDKGEARPSADRRGSESG